MVRVDDGAVFVIDASPLDRIPERVRRHTNSRKGRLRAALLCFAREGDHGCRSKMPRCIVADMRCDLSIKIAATAGLQ